MVNAWLSGVSELLPATFVDTLRHGEYNGTAKWSLIKNWSYSKYTDVDLRFCGETGR